METEVKFKSLIQLTKYFSDEAKCVEHLEQLRWGNERGCVHCGSTKTYVCKGLGKYKCGDCGERFSVKTKTFFENSKIPLSKWFIAMYLCLSHKKGVSSIQLATDIGVTQKTAWFILHRIRLLVNERAPQMLTGTIEADETFIGGKDRFKSKKKRKELVEQTKATGSGFRSEKAVVVGLLQRDGKLILKHIPNAKAENMVPFVEKHVAKGSELFTDEHYAYARTTGYIHQSVRHSVQEYKVGKTHTNTLEGAWALFKRSVYGIHHSISKKHLQKYATAFAFKYSTRDYTEQQRFDLALSKCSEGRLTYWDLIKNDSMLTIFQRNDEIL